VKWDENPRQEEFMFLLQRQSKPIDDGSKYLQQLGDAIETFRFVRKLKKNVVDRTSNIGPEIEKFSINPVQGCLEKVAFSRILGVE
jgi:hypothetical protein